MSNPEKTSTTDLPYRSEGGSEKGPDSSDFNGNRLPSLQEILHGQSAPPLDLHSFFIYVQEEYGSTDQLDFWLDVRQYMVNFDRLFKCAGDRSESNYGSNRSRPTTADIAGSDVVSSEDANAPTSQSRHTISPSPGGDAESSRELLQIPENATEAERKEYDELKELLHGIYLNFINEWAEREIALPQEIMEGLRDKYDITNKDFADPVIFEDAFNYVFTSIETNFRQRFLARRTQENISHRTIQIYALVGLFAIFSAFWTAFVLIFLDYSRSTRCWLILPFTVATYFLTAHTYHVDPITALIGLSEYPSMHWNSVVDRKAGTLLFGRGAISLLVALGTAALFCVLFILVPGKRL